MIILEGRLSYDEERPKLLVEKLTPWEVAQKSETVVRKQETSNLPDMRLYVKITSSQYDETCDILDAYKGDIPVVLVIDGERKYAPMKVRQAKGLIYELAGLLGDGNAIFKDKTKK